MAFFAEWKEKSYKSSEKRIEWVTLNNSVFQLCQFSNEKEKDTCAY